MKLSSCFSLGPPSHPQPPSSDVLKKKEKERLFREQQQRLKSTAITKTAKNPLDELFGAQSVKQATQEKAAPTLVQSSTSDDQLCGTTVKDTVGQLPNSDQPVEATAPVEPSKPSGSKSHARSMWLCFQCVCCCSQQWENYLFVKYSLEQFINVRNYCTI